MRNKTINRKFLLCLGLISVIFIGISASVFAAQSTYQSNLSRGSQTLTVSAYNKDSWKKAVGNNPTPDDWFKGDADKLNSQSRITIRSIAEVKYDSFDLWLLLFGGDMSKEATGVFALNKNNINTEYDSSYKAWEVLYGKWDFSSDNFEEDPDTANGYFVILENPKNYKDILDNYNEWVATMNIALQLNPETQGISFSNYTTEEFFWFLTFNELVVVATPIDNYLNAVIDTLNIKHVEVKDTTLTIEKSDYSIEISYDSNGMQNAIVVMDKNGKSIYQISQDTSNQIWLVVIPIIVILSIVGLIYLAIKNKSKRN